MINVKRISIFELLAFVSQPSYANWDVVPISRHRAKSYVSNPRSSPKDIVLYLAYENDTLVGYRTVLPDLISANNEEIKVGWLSGSWVDPSFRRKGISTILLNEIFADWNSNLIYTNYAPEAKYVFDKSQKFFFASKLIGTRIYVRSCLADLLVYKSKVFKFLSPLLKVVDSFLNLFNILPLLIRSMNLKGIEFEYLSSPDNDVLSLFEKINQNAITYRKAPEFKWIVQYPWVISAPLGDIIGRKYFFSSAPKRFNQQLFKVYKDGSLIGFVMLNSRDGAVSSPYIHCESGNERIFAKILLKHAAILDASRITIFNEPIAKEIRSIFLYRIFSRKQTRNYFISSSLSDKLNRKPLFIEGDGDCAFV
jgi:GNAT superfamily N-acetyltransferase